MCMQKEGALQIAQPKGAPPLPPFERWSFKERRYIQWLADMHTAHYTLEAAIADAAVVAATEHYGMQMLKPLCEAMDGTRQKFIIVSS